MKEDVDELKNYEDGKLITAYVLFVELATKVTHLTLRSLGPVPPPSLNQGEIVKAEVKKKLIVIMFSTVSTCRRFFDHCLIFQLFFFAQN